MFKKDWKRARISRSQETYCKVQGDERRLAHSEQKAGCLTWYSTVRRHWPDLFCRWQEPVFFCENQPGSAIEPIRIHASYLVTGSYASAAAR